MFMKIWDAVSKVFLVLCGVFALLFVLNLCLYHIPKCTPTDVSLEVVKLNEYGEPVGTYPITIKGHLKEYLFRSDSLDVDISPFDGFESAEPVLQSNDRIYGAIRTWDRIDWRKTSYSVGKPNDEYFYYFEIFFSPDFKDWMIYSYGLSFNDSENMQSIPRYYYVGSTEPQTSLEDLKEYFKGAYTFKELPSIP